MRKSPTLVWLLLAIALVFGWRQLQTNTSASTPDSINASADVANPAGVGITPAPRADPASRPPSQGLPDFLPPEAGEVVSRIRRGGPFPNAQDGSVFGNYEGRLPRQPRGWYREYTVPTPGLSHRGTRRIVTGGTPPQVWYYSADHYRSFRRFDIEDAPP